MVMRQPIYHVVLALVATGIMAALPTTTGQIPSIDLPGASGSGPFTVVTEWAVAFQAQFPEAAITMDSVGSGKAQSALWGKIDCENRPVTALCAGNPNNEQGLQTVWGIGDAPFESNVYEDHPEMQFQHLPAMAAAVVPLVSGPPQVNLTMEVIAGIFAGEILFWDEPILKEINPSAELPHETINVVTRTDSSGQNYIFTDGLGRLVPSWPRDAIGDKPDWPLNQGGDTVQFTTEAWLFRDANTCDPVATNSTDDTDGSAFNVELADGMISAVLRIPWSIGYATLEFYSGYQEFISEIRVSGIPLMSSVTRDNSRHLNYEDNFWTRSFVTPGNESILMGVEDATLNPMTMDLTFAGVDTVGDQAYPLVGFGYWYFKKTPDAFESCYQAWLVAKFMEWSYMDPLAAEIAFKYGWVVPPKSVAYEAFKKLHEIQCYGDDGQIISVWDYIPPRFEHELNYIDDTLLIVGYALVGLVGLVAIGCAAFLYLNRKEWHVKVSQPEALGVVILGCVTSSLAIIFMGFQAGFPQLEDEQTMNAVDAGCMAVPWLYGVGFVLTFSMLFAKISRVQLIFLQANMADSSRVTDGNDKKKRIRFADVWHIIALMMVVELGILICWQLISPLRWERVVVQEINGIEIESVGECTSDSGFWFFAALVGFHVVCLFYALVLAVKTNHIDSSFAESKYISLSVAFMFQVLIMAVPIAALVRDNTTVYYLVRVLAVFLQSFTVLALLFVPKIKMVMTDGNARRNEGGSKHKMKNSIKLSALTNSKWDAGVDTINELLEVDGDTYTTMTDEQRAELENIKVLLLERTDNDSKQDMSKFLPTQLLRGRNNKKNSFDDSSSGRVDQATAAYIMREFGGVNVDGSSSRAGVTSEESNDDSDFGLLEDSSTHVLPEFKQLSGDDRKKVCDLLSIDSIKSWGFNIFELKDLVGKSPLLFMGWAVLGSPHSQRVMAKLCRRPEPDEDTGYNFADSELQIPMSTLCDYLRVINDDYQDNPYHNSTHAADVLQSLHSMLQMDSALIPTKLELFSILLAAAVHDVDHPGLNNAFQANAKTDLALIYNDKSVLENKHAAHAFLKMMGDEGTKQSANLLGKGRINHGRESDLNILCNAPSKDIPTIRSHVIDAIMHTDMSAHFALVNHMKGLILGDDSGLTAISENERWKILTYMMHMADISGQAKRDPLFLRWCERVTEEFFQQGDKEAELGLPISNLCDRKTTQVNDSQIGFIQFVIKPSFEVLGDFIPEVKHHVVPIIQGNYEYYVKHKKINHQKMEEAP